MQVRNRLFGKPIGSWSNNLTQDFKAELMPCCEEKHLENLYDWVRGALTQRAGLSWAPYDSRDISHCLIITSFLDLLQLDRDFVYFADQWNPGPVVVLTHSGYLLFPDWMDKWRRSSGEWQVCGVQLCLLYGSVVETVLTIAIVEGDIDNFQRQNQAV